MSKTIIGYINSQKKNELISLENDIQRETAFGFKFKNGLNLYNYPQIVLLRDDIVQFVISDSRELNTATILLNEYDYDPEDESESDFQKRFPSLLKDRIFEITKIIKFLLNVDSVRELGFSLSDCDEVEQVKHSSIESFESLVVADCIKDCPPNTLYVIDK
ncbi:hypothetical protein BS333_17070 [Vibrio azureus]|uniref:Uncharacterized protein n=1 Tax=Vibrio azureus NBRC 104587 TaxID=1219077 RepID=U3C8G7_9VIBR|nr:hypothetical protein [Vibrio azureus]AUI88082.1 hypothetical protein BS333_17070 [Vibrio azureus]GAD77664.1 hypothetical protein VAZ01S_085_00100 [Vibrio azureus NBRC 104587]